MKLTWMVLLVTSVVLAAGTPGTLDENFGTDGIARLSGAGSLAQIARQSDGAIVAAGSDGIVRRFFDDGSPDTDFGVVTLFPDASAATAVDIVVDGSDRILVAGSVTEEFLSGKGKKPKTILVTSLVVVRLTANGATDWTFQREGGRVRALAVHSDGVVLVGDTTFWSRRTDGASKRPFA